jgi:serine/threonine protein kinase/tetratricopeptide (TPR) repeat protein
MDQAQWRRISEVFDQVIQLPFPQREDFVRLHAHGDARVVSEVLAMLAADYALAAGLASDAFLKPLGLPDDVLKCFEPPPPPFHSGQIVRGRFRIVRSIGEGGMGHVYEAWDEELELRIALKVIRSEVSDNADSLARFRREVRVGLMANHPNICRTFQIDHEISPSTASGTPRKIHFFTMEFLAGETLAARLARVNSISRALPLGEALAFARDVAAALDCAHRLGVVHRDVKPANVMLVPGGLSLATATSAETPLASRAVVTDFGLAHLDPLLAGPYATSLSRSGFTAGTLAYMAPEQLEGGLVSPATDIYAFGLLLYEMATGQRAHRAAGRIAPMSLNRQLPLHWEQVIERCLAYDPSCRFQRATEAVTALADTYPPLSLNHPLNHPAPGPSPSDTEAHVNGSMKRVILNALYRAPIVIVVSILIPIALFFAAFHFYMGQKAGPQINAGGLVYLAPVRNQTDDKALEHLTELLEASLSQSAHINLLDEGRAGDILQQMTKAANSGIDSTTAREIALRAGAVRVVLATVSRSGDRYTLTLDIQQPDPSTPARPRHRWTRNWSWQSMASATPANRLQTTIPAEVLTQVRDATDWVRQQVGESAHDIANLNGPPEDVTTSNWNALKEYSSALRLNSAGRPTDAVVALENAVRNDQQFALAYGALGDILLTLHREDEGFAAYKKALDPNNERRLSRRERDRIRAMYAVDTWDFAAAVDALRDYQTFYPVDPIGWLYPAYPLRMLDRVDEAIADMKKAVEIEPRNPRPVLNVADLYVSKNDLVTAKDWFARSRALGGSEDLEAIGASILFLEGQYDAAEKTLIARTGSENPRARSRGYEGLASIEAERGRFTEAIRTLNEGMQEDRAQGNPAAQSSKFDGRAFIEAKLGQLDDSYHDMQEAIRLDPSADSLMAVESVLGPVIATIPRPQSKRFRDLAAFLQGYAPKNDNGPIFQIAGLRVRAEALLARGDISAAVREFRHLSVVDAPSTAREYLGRALKTAASYEKEPSKRRQLIVQATEAYAKVALRPSAVWADPLAYPPGFLADELDAYIQLCQNYPDTSRNMAAAINLLHRLRGQDSPHPDAAQ